MAVEVEVKKWGNSIGVVLPKTLIDKEQIKENDKIIIQIVKKANISHLFGTLKRKMPTQELKDMVRKGWEKSR